MVPNRNALAFFFILVFAGVQTAIAAPLSGFITQNLAPGDAGEEVRLLQEWLSSDRSLYPEGKVTGTYDAATERAVKRYQEEKGMVLMVGDDGGASGKVGPMTRANLNADFSPTQGGVAVVEAAYGAAQVFDGKKFVPLSETRYLANKRVMSRLEAWVYPLSVSENDLRMLTNGDGYAIGTTDSGRLYAKTPNGVAVTRKNYLSEGEWQHVAVLFTAHDAVFIFDNKVVETIPLEVKERYFFSGFFDGLLSQFRSFSFTGFRMQKPAEAPESAPASLPAREPSGVVGWLSSFVDSLLGKKPSPLPNAVDTVSETASTTTPVSEEPEVAAIPVPPQKPAEKPKAAPKPLIPPLFAPTTTTVVIPLATSTLPVGHLASTTSSTTPKAAATTAAATTTASSSSATGTSTVSLGGSGGGGAAATNASPTITLSGSSPVSIPTGTVYTDPGATAADAEEGNLTSSVMATGTVNHLIPGDYTITYTVSDSRGATATASRVVTVTPPTPIPEAQQVPQYALSPAGQQVSFSVDSGSANNPRFTYVDINPLHVYVGDTQTLTVTVSSPGGVASVRAVTQLDTVTLTLDLQKTNESGDTATFSTSWVVYDTHVRTYRTTFTATANSGATNSTTMAWSDPCSGVTQGANSSLSADCTVSSVDGLDGGTLTIPSGRTLTINSGGTWGFNPGTSIIIDGVLSKGTGGQIRKGYLFYADCTNCVDTNTRYFFTTTPQTGYTRLKDYSQSYYQTFYYSETSYCLAPETLIHMADGGYKAITDVRVGDMVMGQNVDGVMRPNIVTKTFAHDPWENEYRPFETLVINGRITVTAEHPFMTARGFVEAGDLKVGDIMIGTYSPEKILSIEEGPALPSVYNLEVYPDHSYFADGVLVHNKFHHDFVLPP